MFKQAWRSYILHFHPSSMKKVKNSEFYLIHRIWVWLLIGNLIWGWSYWYEFLHFIPIYIMAWSCMDGGIRLEKKMFLSPMKKQDREMYVRYLLLFHIGVPVVTGILVEIIRSFVIGITIWPTIGKLLCYLFAGVGFFIHESGIDKEYGTVQPARKDKNGKLKWSWINTMTGLGGLMAISWYDTSRIYIMESNISWYILGICVVVLLVCSLIILSKQYGPMMEYLTDYNRVSGFCIKDKYIQTEQ